jgi:hypothetical protein
MAMVGEIGWIGKDCPDYDREHPELRVKLESKVMRSNAGYFIGTQCPICSKSDPSPNSRETDYYPSREALAQAALDGTVVFRDTHFRPAKLTLLDLDGASIEEWVRALAVLAKEN